MVLPSPPEISESERKWLMTVRQTLLMQLGAIEERLGLERSVVPKRKKKEWGAVDYYITTED